MNIHPLCYREKWDPFFTNSSYFLPFTSYDFFNFVLRP